MLPERIGEAAKEGDLETIRAYFEDDSNGERSPPAFDGMDHSKGICASRTASFLRFEGLRCAATSRMAG